MIVQANSEGGEISINIGNDQISIENTYIKRNMQLSNGKLKTHSIENKMINRTFTPSAGSEDFMKHSKEKGWFEITYIVMDERPLEPLKKAVELIESIKDENGNHFKISSALNYASPEHYEFTDKIHDISINIDNTRNYEELINLSNHRREKGLVTTHYSCTGNYPTNFIISDPGDNYWTMFYTETIRTDGFMCWAWDNYVYDMHGDISYRYWEPGDG